MPEIGIALIRGLRLPESGPKAGCKYERRVLLYKSEKMRKSKAKL
jgi:hypothetical protein